LKRIVDKIKYFYILMEDSGMCYILLYVKDKYDDMGLQYEKFMNKNIYKDIYYTNTNNVKYFDQIRTMKKELECKRDSVKISMDKLTLYFNDNIRHPPIDFESKIKDIIIEIRDKITNILKLMDNISASVNMLHS